MTEYLLACLLTVRGAPGILSRRGWPLPKYSVAQPNRVMVVLRMIDDNLTTRPSTSSCADDSFLLASITAC